MNKLTLTRKTGLIFVITAVILSLLIFSLLYSPFSVRDEEKEEEDDREPEEKVWREYPYVIPETDIRFPDEEGLYPDDETGYEETWISLGMRLDFIDPIYEDTYLVTLYHENFKDICISSPGNIYKDRFYGEQTLSEGKMDMTFENPTLPEDVFRTKEGEAFHYEFRSYFEIGGQKFELDLEFEAEKPPVTMKEFGGEVEIGERYYRVHHLTHCTISGTVKIGEEPYEVGGVVWIENRRGLFRTWQWEWFGFWADGDVEFKIVDLYGDDENIEYALYVDNDGKTTPIDDLRIERTSFKNNFGYSWNILSDEHDVDLKITCIDERMHYGAFAIGVGEVSGRLMGSEIDTLAYLELTKSHHP